MTSTRSHKNTRSGQFLAASSAFGQAAVWALSLACGMAGCSSSSLDTPPGEETAQRTALGTASAGASSVASPVALPAPVAPAGHSLQAHPASRSGANSVIVKFKSTGPSGVVDSIDSALARVGTLAAATADGSPSLDHLLKVHGLSRPEAFVHWRRGLSTAAAQIRQATLTTRLAKKAGGAATQAIDVTNVYLFQASGDVEAAAAELAQDPHVEYAQPNYPMRANFTPNDPFFSSTGSFGQPYTDLWGVQSTHTPPAWDLARGAGVIVAVVDTGVDRNHPDLAPNIWQNPLDPSNGIDDDGNGLVDDTFGWNYASGNNDTIDRIGHGTHVAGTIAAQDNNALGIVGIAPDAKIMPVKGFDDSGNATAFSLAQGIIYAAEHGADVINNSWGCSSPCPTNPVAADAVERARVLGSVVVFSAGNSNQDVAGFAPNNHPKVIAVGASTPSGVRASFSNTGEIDLVAPGSGDDNGTFPSPLANILSLKSALCDVNTVCPPSLVVGGQYLRLAGTSMAAPHVSGLAALILSRSPNLTPEQVRQVLRRSADDLNGDGFDLGLGYGQMSSLRALNEPAPLEAVILSPAGLQTGTAAAVVGTVKGPGLASWTLERGQGEPPASWTLVAQGTAAVDAAQLGTLPLSSMPDGVPHILRLRAQTSDGRLYEDRQVVTFDRVQITAPLPPVLLRGGGQISITGTVAPGTLHHFEVQVTLDGVAQPSSQITLTGGGTSPVVNNVIALWNTAGVAAGMYEITLRAVLTNSTVFTEVTSCSVDPALHAGWPLKLGGTAWAAMSDVTTLADVNGDGKQEIVLAQGGVVRIYRHDATALPGWPQNAYVGTPAAGTPYSPAVGDITGDGLPEVVAANDRGQIFVWNRSGVLQAGWPRTVGTGTRHRITLADIDRNGVKDIVSADNNGKVHVLTASGAVAPGFPVTSGPAGTDQAPPIVADLDRNGTPEIIVLDYGFTQTSVFSNTGSMRPGWPKAATGFNTAVAVGDLEGDGLLEVVTAGAFLTAYRADGTIVPGWPFDLVSLNISSVTVADVNGDGAAEVLSGASGKNSANILYVLNGAGQVLPNWPQSTSTPVGSVTFGRTALADLDGDGQVEIAAGCDVDGFGTGFLTNQDRLKVFGLNGTVKTALEHPVLGRNASRDSSPAIGDVDTDASFEMVYADFQGNLYLWDLPGANTGRKPWPMFQFDSNHTGLSPQTPIWPRRIQAEAYNRFSDSTPANQGASGSPSCSRGDAVDIQTTTDQSGVCAVGWTTTNEWLEYDVNLPSGGAFDFTLRVGSGVTGRQTQLSVDGTAYGTVSAPNVGWSSYGNRVISSVPLSAGNHVVRLTFVTNDVNINYFEITPTLPVTLPARIEAEAYDRFLELDAPNNGALAGDVQCDQGNSVDLWHTADQGGLCNIGWTLAGEWLEYDVYSPAFAGYNYVLRAASGASGKRVRLYVDGQPLTSWLVATGGWDTYQNFGEPVFLSKGAHVLRVVFETGDVNLNFLNLTLQ